ncbi:MAG: phage holin family protein [Pacificimonas sp.]
MIDRGEDNATLGELVHVLAAEASNLVHAEVRLAEAKMAQRIRMASKAIVLLAVGGAFAFIALATIMFALGAWLAQSMGAAVAALIVAVIGIVVAGFLFVMGRTRFVAVFGGARKRLSDKAKLI